MTVLAEPCQTIPLLHLPVLHLLFTFLPRSQQTSEQALHAYLLREYSPFVAPIIRTNVSASNTTKNDKHTSTMTTTVAKRAVNVTFGFELMHLVSVAESEQTVTQKVWLRMQWHNCLMVWNASQWGGVAKTRLAHSQVWTPDLFLQEDVSSDMSTGPEKYKTQVIIRANGEHKWYVPTLIKSSCTFNVANFPFDRQQCKLVFTSWTHDIKELDLNIDPRAVVTSNYVNSTEWDLVHVKRKRIEKSYDCCPNPFVDITYTIHLRRKPLYYVYSVIAPCMIQMVIILFTFFLPPGSGERIGVVITVLLVFAVYLDMISNSLPRTSTSTPALSRFYIAAMAESACSLIATCFVLIIHFKGEEKGVGPMPAWVRHFFIEALASYLGVCRNIDPAVVGEDMNALDGRGSYASLNNICNKDTGCQQQTGNTRNVKKRNKSSRPDVATMSTLMEEMKVITSTIKDQEKQDEVEEEWQVLGKVFDRLFFFMFLIIFVVSSLVILLPVYINRDKM